MKNKTIYLCGPIANCSDKECIDWREKVKTWGYPTLDPMRRDYRGIENENVKDIVELDKIDITQSDVVLVNFHKPSVGTSMEILYAFERGKLVIVVAENDIPVSPWMTYHSHRVVKSFGEAQECIDQLF